MARDDEEWYGGVAGLFVLEVVEAEDIMGRAWVCQ